jgi:hypothetical protein
MPEEESTRPGVESSRGHRPVRAAIQHPLNVSTAHAAAVDEDEVRAAVVVPAR